VQSDPIGLQGGWGLFIYSHSSPTSKFDNFGLSVKENRAAGKAFEAKFENSLDKCGCNYRSQVYFKTPTGGRFLDQVIYDDKGNPIQGFECKQGGARYSGRQAAKDAWIESNFGFPIDVVR
jgi:hypothetical protein